MYIRNTVDGLTQEQRDHLKRALEALREELTQALDASQESVKPVELDQPIGRVSRIDAISQQHIAAASRKQHAMRLRRVNRALTALEKDEYGLCGHCEEPIGYRRLQAKPECILCLECQAAKESS